MRTEKKTQLKFDTHDWVGERNPSDTGGERSNHWTNADAREIAAIENCRLSVPAVRNNEKKNRVGNLPTRSHE